jgi:hypothetical protein
MTFPFTRLVCLLVSLLNLTFIKAQQNIPKSELLSVSRVAAIFTDSVKKEFRLNYPIFRVYRYVDRSGEYYCVLTESNDYIVDDEEKKDTISHALRAVDLRVDQGRLIKEWEINDNIIKNGNNETTIRFWTRFSDFKDLDGDGLIEPFIIYGTKGSDGYDNGRIKFIIYYKGRKIAMRHQGCDLDDGRETAFDASYSALPKVLKDAIDAKMEQIRKEFNIVW